MFRPTHLGLLGLSAALVGCIPTWPQVSPEVAGTISVQGKPIAGAELYVLKTFRPDNCQKSDIHAASSEDGSFFIPGSHEFEWNIPGDRIVHWGLCIHYEGQWFTGYSESHMGFPREKVRLSCDLSAPAEARPPDAFSKWPHPHVFGLCKEHEV